jgi:DNA repair protein RadA/Sms
MSQSRQAGYRCAECGTTVHKWVGRCASCNAWNTLEPAAGGTPGSSRARPVADVALAHQPVRASGLGEFDRVVNGGLPAGSVTLLAGEPGVGKSTLALQVALGVVRSGGRALYVTAEESPEQVARRVARLGGTADGLWLSGATAVCDVIAEIESTGADLVVVDSIQTVRSAASGSTPGSVSQVRDGAVALSVAARASGAALVLVGHVTKDGSLAGPRQLEHLVDTVLSFEGDRHQSLRLLRAVKHRYGPTSELGLFDMDQDGLRDLPDASGLLLADRRPGVPGSVIFPFVDGRRPLLVEVQALVVPGAGPSPRRSAQGVDSGRLGLALAVLGRVLGLPVLDAEVYCLAVGGVRVRDPGADLAVMSAVISSITDRPVPADVVVCGEVGLNGEVRMVRHLDRRLAEAARAGFRRAVVPATASLDADLEVVPVRTVADAVDRLGLALPLIRPRSVA